MPVQEEELSEKVLIVGDGKTEKNYFDGLTCVNPDILIRSFGEGKTGIDQVIRKTRTHMSDLGIDIHNGDRVAIVMDLDLRYTRREVSDMIGKCSKYGIELYVSNPCFEVWLILHFHKYTKPSNPEDMIVQMEDVLGHPYKKSQYLEWTRDMVEKALSNAHGLYGDSFGACDCSERNPSTTVQNLVSSLV